MLIFLPLLVSIIRGGRGAEVDVGGGGFGGGCKGGGGGGGGMGTASWGFFSLIQYKRIVLFIINAYDQNLPFVSLEFHKKEKQTVQHKKGNSIQIRLIIHSKT